MPGQDTEVNGNNDATHPPSPMLALARPGMTRVVLIFQPRGGNCATCPVHGLLSTMSKNERVRVCTNIRFCEGEHFARDAETATMRKKCERRVGKTAAKDSKTATRQIVHRGREGQHFGNVAIPSPPLSAFEQQRNGERIIKAAQFAVGAAFVITKYLHELGLLGRSNITPFEMKKRLILVCTNEEK